MIIDNEWDSLKSLLWQYDGASKLKQLLENRQEFYDASTKDFLNSFIKNVLNLKTANTFGLNIWGNFLKIERPTYIDDDGNRVFYSDEQYRLLLLAKVLKFNKRPTVANINEFLAQLYENGGFVDDLNNMELYYTIFSLPVKIDELQNRLDDFFLRPAGVKITVQPIILEDTFGFDGSELQPFNQGNFIITGYSQ